MRGDASGGAWVPGGRAGEIETLLGVAASYLIGSLPTALIVSRLKAGTDIREQGDGNMGARNTTHVYGWGPGIIVGLADFLKGALSVFLARSLGLSLDWQLGAAAAAALGHDFPIWAGLRGGQGMAAILGGLFVLAPGDTLIGLVTFAGVYALTQSFDLSAAIGLGALAYVVGFAGRSPLLTLVVIGLFLSIPAKKILDWPRRRRISAAQSSGDLC